MTRPITAMESQLPTEFGDINEEEEEEEEEKGMSSRENGRKVIENTSELFEWLAFHCRFLFKLKDH